MSIDPQTEHGAAKAGRAVAGRLNFECFCGGASLDEIRRGLAERIGDAPAALLAVRPHLVSDALVFVSASDYAAMRAFVAAAETAIRLPAYRRAALSRIAPELAVERGEAGVFMGFDFHLTPTGPRLIEINTNAGGAFINAALASMQRVACPGGEALRPIGAENFERAVLSMFSEEFARAFPGRDLKRVAIVDDAPEHQYLYPEFLLAKRLFDAAGVEAVIVDARELAFSNGALWAQRGPVDLVYNRLTDFMLAEPSSAALRAAWIAGAVAVTPSPPHHALYADKRNLVLLSDSEAMRAMGLSAPEVDALALAPAAKLVADGNADALWTARRDLFFKPVAGYASRAVYRGDKMTKSVWSEIRKGGYIAQDYAPPGERRVRLDGAEAVRKMDIRLYAYRGEILLAAARLYQGQTTNFRTPGGGFAPVIVI